MAYEEEQVARQWIESPDEILRLLHQTLVQHNPVFLQSEHLKHNTFLREINLAEGWIEVDAPESPTRTPESGTNQDIRISYTSPQGAHTHFTTSIFTGAPTATGRCKLRFPSELRYQQRRACYRHPIRRGCTLEMELNSSKAAILHAVIEDLSLQGLRAVATVPEDAVLLTRTHYHGCKIQLLNQQIHCTLNIVSAQPCPDPCQRQLRAVFIWPSQAEQRLLGHALTALERESIRQQKRTRLPFHLTQ